MGEQSAESSVIRTYLDTLLSVPWNERSEEKLDPTHAREILDADHAGLDDVKDRIVEYIAVKKLRVDRGIQEDKRSGAILTLIGPPGTGKTSDRRVDRPCHRPQVRAHVAWAACVTRPRSAVTGGPTSARCRDGWSVPCATPGP